MLYDEQALYVGARMYDDSPGAIARQLVRRDETGQFNLFELSLDPNLDLRTGYVFQISAAGVQGDAFLFDDGYSYLSGTGISVSQNRTQEERNPAGGIAPTLCCACA